MPYVEEGDLAIVWDAMGEAFPPDDSAIARQLNGDMSLDYMDELEAVLSGDALASIDYVGTDEMGGFFSFVKKAAKGAVKGVGKGIKGVAKAGRSVGKALGKVPVVGSGLKGVFNLTLNQPFQMAGAIASGKRLDRVALGTLQNTVKSIGAVGPYAQSVLSFVPVVGPGINAGLSTGLALASGRPLTSAIAAGLKATLPGGPLAASAFDMGKAAIEGKGISSIALAGLPVGDAEKKAIGMGLDAAGRIAKGQRVDDAILAQADRAIGMLPKDAATGLKAGIALAQGRSLQATAIKALKPGVAQVLQRVGVAQIEAIPTLARLGASLPAAQRPGFSAAIGMLTEKPAAPLQVVAIRHQLAPAARPGYDAAIKAYAAAKQKAAAKKKAAPQPVSSAPKAAECKCPPPVVYYVEATGKIRKA